MGDLISEGNQFSRISQLFGSHFCISILKVLHTKILRDSLDFNAFGMIQEYFSQGLEIFSDQRRVRYFLEGANFAECLNYLVSPAVFQS